MGRKSTFTQEIADEICERISLGHNVELICRSDSKFPTPQTIYTWVREREEFAFAYARARDAGHRAMEAEIQEIADTILDKTNPVEVQRAKLRIETRLKLLKIWDPKRYGDKVQIEDATPRPQLSRAEMLAQLQTSGLKVADIFGALTKKAEPVQAIEAAPGPDSVDLGDS